ncbi:carboxypeptidase regulatory-like domain-containing protein [Glaciihabitans arcticus]|uniref:alpha-amylase n=1 Tax=Glaciihabitans arcticus TaxID=2668039 RepID=A0A4Q9GRK1_9MICO|nr:carboxypeptidase-like regulatory domain-containing protein [Glaciihabitans arcticus]TBN57576.1 carboxypeptidase regulatory-like domain-containing protein [Glaciihabitans arcticus]
MNGPALLRSIKLSVTATILGALLAAGLALPAQAAETNNLTVTVRNVTGTPLVGMSIIALSVADGEEIEGDLVAGDYPKAKPVTGKPGVYVFTGLSAIDHTLYFGTATSTTFTQLLGGASEISRAQVIPAGQTSLSVSLASNAVITGIVKTPAKKILPKALVTAYLYTGSDWITYASARADAKGRYTIRDLDPGSYRLKFSGPAGDYSPLYSGGAATFDEASGIVVGVGATATANATFPTGLGAITGTSWAEYSDDDFYGFMPLANARAIAIPVTQDASYPYPVVLDTERSVTSAAANKKGAWTIKNLRPGKYVVKISPWYYNQAATFIGGGRLEYAQVFTVGAGKVVKAGRHDTYMNRQGGSVTVVVRNPGGGAVPGADVLLQSDADPDYYYRGTTNGSSIVTFGKSGKNHTIQPGAFTLSVLTNGSWAPAVQDAYISSGAQTIDVNVQWPSAPDGFVTAPSIAETALVVGTRYEVAAQAHRAAATLTYQWLRDGHPVFGADEAAYTSRAGDIGAQLSVRVASHQFGYPTTTAKASVAGLVVSDVTVPTNVTAPSITPATGAHVGTTLRVLPGSWSVKGLDYGYEWLRNGIPFDNAGSSYVVKLADLDAEFTAVVTATKSGYADATAATPTGVTPVFADAAQLKSGLAVTAAVVKKPKGTKKYTVKPGVWTALAPTFSYEWLRGGIVVGTGPTLTEKPSAALLAQTLEVRATANAPGFGPGTATVLARKSSKAVVMAGTPSVTLGDEPVAASTPVAVGQELVASGSTWEVDDPSDSVSYGYQWLRKVGKAKAVTIKGATLASYKPTAADVGSLLSVTVTARSVRTGNAVKTVAAGTVVTRTGLAELTPTITLEGSTVVGTRLYPSYDFAWQSFGAKVSYQWYGCALPKCTASTPAASFAKIPGATLAYYATPAAYAKGRIYVVETATKAGYTAARAVSDIVTIVPKNVIPVLSRPTVVTETGSVMMGGIALGTQASFGVEIEAINRYWELCVLDCTSPTAVWGNPHGYTDYYQTSYYPSTVDWAGGESYLRFTTVGQRPGYPSVTTSSLPVRLVEGDFSARVHSAVTAGPSNIGKVSVFSSDLPNWAIRSNPRWFVEDTERASGSFYTMQPEDQGKAIYAVVTVSAPGYADVEVVAVAQRRSTSLVATPTTIVGTKLGETLSLADPEPFHDLPQTPHSDWKYSYRWNYGHVGSGDQATFDPIASHVGQQIQVEIYVTSPVYGWYSTTVYSAAPLLEGDPLTVEEDAALFWDGDLLPGALVSASELHFSEPEVETSYLWQTSIDDTTWVDTNETSGIYEIDLHDSNLLLRVVATGTKPGHDSVVSTSAPAQVLEGDVIRLLGAPALSGNVRVGSTLTTTAGAWSEGAVPSIQWLLNGRAIPGATGPTYVPLATHAGDEISVRVTARQAGKLDVSAETAALTIATGLAPVATKAPVITGTTTLTATPGVWNTSGLTYTFEWTRVGSEPVLGETLVLPAGHLRAEYTLTVRAERFGYEPGVVTAH